ncbi:MAG: 16S rRNA (adenine(1518)-N(6)/adenine(1519)-N(6))-dimethyltransferase RsmA [Actinomycetota bacterium]|nr:16S rRNA (adenine(1518)-N(6)/adenine(1519)-N(6))-dimethyltransferase RsmA [Actinomycetota bacterium]
MSVPAPDRLGRGDVRRLLEANGLAPSKALGQHFVVDPNTIGRIVRLAAIGEGEQVLEIGPGLGSLTLGLAATGAPVTAVEIDGDLVGVLAALLPPSVRVVHADALGCDWPALLGGGRWVVVANLPYNVATPLVIRLLQEAPAVGRMVVMVQKEAGERLAATPGSKAYGAVTVRVAYYATARLAGEVAPEVFLPRPNVASALVELHRRPAPAVPAEVASYDELDRLVRAGFGGRRKMLRRSLAGLVDAAAFEAAGIPGTARAEDLDVVAWGKLAACQRSIASPRPPS